MIRRSIAVLAFVLAMLLHPVSATAIERCSGSGPFCAGAILDPSQVTFR